MKALLFLLIAIATSQASLAGRHLIVVVPPYLPVPVREDAARLSAKLLYEPEPGTRVTVFDSARMVTITDHVVPAGTLKFRMAVATPQLTNVTAIIRGASDGARHFDPPAIFDYVGRQLRSEGGELSVILMGPAIYRNPKEPLCDMSSKWPSDGHLVAPRSVSIFSTLDRSNVLRNVAVSWYVTDAGSVTNDTHADGLSRFWSLYIATQGGVLAGYSPDLLNAFAIARGGRQVAFRPVQLDRTDAAPQMHSALRVAPSPSREAESPIAQLGSTPPTLVVTKIVVQTNTVTVTNEVVALRETILPKGSHGKALIGLVWAIPKGASERVDLDLHVGVPSDSAELSFLNTKTPKGRYFRDVREATGAGFTGDWATSWEAVELDDDQLPAEAWVHIYSGRGPCQGELRVIYKGVEYRSAFTFPAVKGDGNASVNRRTHSDRWIRVNLSFVTSRR
jgi:hypothetical protein